MQKIIKRTTKFNVAYKKRVFKNEKLKQEYLQSVRDFLDDRGSVNDHQLWGKMKLFRAFSINNEYRVVYLENDNEFLFINIGTHEQVYKLRR